MTTYTQWKSLVDETEYNAIPDSAISHWPMASGSGSTITDEVGTADLSANADFAWDDTTSSWDSGWATDYDGVDDGAQASASDMPDTGDAGTMLLTFRARDFDNNSSSHVFYHRSDGSSDDRLYLRFESSGEYRVGLAASAPTHSYSFNTDTNYRVALRWDTGDYDVFFNGSNDASGTYSETVTSNASSFNLGIRDNPSDPDPNPYDGYLDNGILTDEPLSNSEISNDYDQQPWS